MVLGGFGPVLVLWPTFWCCLNSEFGELFQNKRSGMASIPSSPPDPPLVPSDSHLPVFVFLSGSVFHLFLDFAYRSQCYWVLDSSTSWGGLIYLVLFFFFFANDRRVSVYLSSMREHIVTQYSFNVCMPSKIHAEIQFSEAVVLRKIISYRLLPHK